MLDDHGFFGVRTGTGSAAIDWVAVVRALRLVTRVYMPGARGVHGWALPPTTSPGRFDLVNGWLRHEP